MSESAMAILLAFIVGLIIGSACTYGHFYMRVLPEMKRYVDTRFDTLYGGIDRTYDAVMSTDPCELRDLEQEAMR